MTKPEDTLIQTLNALKLCPGSKPEIDVLASAPPEARNKVAQVYDVANAHLAKIDRVRNIDPCIHVTGEMRALLNETHRNACRQVWDKVAKPALFVGHWGEGEFSVEKFVRSNRANWGNFSWQGLFDAVSLATDGVARLQLVQDEPLIQYSLFADRYVLLQSHHTKQNPHKHVWFLDAPWLNEELRPKAERVLEDSMSVEVRQLRDFTLSLVSDLSLGIVIHLEKQTKEISVDELSSVFRSEARQLPSLLDKLSAAGLINYVDENKLEVTRDGEDLIRSFQCR